MTTLGSSSLPTSETPPPLPPGDDLLKPIRYARNVAVVYALLSTAFIVGAMLTDASGRFAELNDPLALADPIVVLLIALGIHAKSRVCAIALVVLSVTNILIQLLDGSPVGVLWHIALIYLGVKATAASFRYHRAYPRKKRSVAAKLFLILPASALGLLIVAVVGLGVLSDTGIIPPTTALSGSAIHKSYLESLRARGIIDPDETVKFFYSAGLLSIESDGNLFTDRRVISYSGDKETLWVAEAAYPEIENILLEESDTVMDDSLITIFPKGQEPFYLIVSAEAEGDRKFYNALLQTWHARR